jgi:bifunctional DNase/RNase
VSEMTMLVIGWDVARDAPVLLIQESGPARRVLAVDIDLPEAIAIAAAVDDEHDDDPAEPAVGPPRPTTHQLITDVLDAFDSHLDHVELSAVSGGFVQAALVLDHNIPIQARPGDALALALQQHRPIHATEEVLSLASTDENTALIALAEEDDDEDVDGGEPHITEAEIAQFRTQLDRLGPDDLTAD